jgi:GxxExxY protein
MVATNPSTSHELTRGEEGDTDAHRITQINVSEAASAFICSICVLNKNMEAKHKDITELIIKAFYTVYNTLGYGFLEKVYENAMVIELRKLGLEVIPEACIKVYYNSKVVGEYFADLLVAGAVIVEIKAVRTLAPEHEAQLLNYLKATPYEVGLLLNPSTGSGQALAPSLRSSAKSTTTSLRAV